MIATVPFYPCYVSVADIHTALAGNRLLAAIEFGSHRLLPSSDPRCFQVDLPLLGETDHVEAWFSQKPVVANKSGNIIFAHNGDILFGRVSQTENPTQADLATLTSQIYQNILQFLSSSGYPYPIRMWNYLSNITATEMGSERYHAFSVGRYNAFAEQPHFEQNLPAASALGKCHNSPLQVYFLASRTPAKQIENPRQMSAFCYPRQYGSKSPSFSRAMLHQQDDTRYFYISGTASIVGHETCHPSDCHAQLQETLRNINALIDTAKINPTLHTIADLSLLKVYIRHPKQDWQNIQDTILRGVASDVPTLYLQADICRDDLLLEIEGIYVET